MSILDIMLWINRLEKFVIQQILLFKFRVKMQNEKKKQD